VEDDSVPGDVALSKWISECHAALASADALAARLARLPGGSTGEIAELRARIMTLRAALERREVGQPVAGRRQLHPSWSNLASVATPWCPPGETG